MDAAETLGEYEIRGELGRGAMGVVLEGWDPHIQRRTAIKVVKLPHDPEAGREGMAAWFRREAQVAASLNHPNIVAVYKYGETRDVAYIAMEYVDGPTLQALFDKGQRFAIAEITKIMDGLLDGLQYGHDKGVHHRDIKPGNLMLTAEHRLKITDFGFARIEGDSATDAGCMIGSPAYMSPEQIAGRRIDARTDIYSAGVVLYELLTGKRPFAGADRDAVIDMVLHGQPPPPSRRAMAAPEALDQVVLRALAKRPADRFASAAEFAQAIHVALDVDATWLVRQDGRWVVGTAPGVAAAAPAAAARRTRLRPLVLAAGVAIVLAGAYGAWHFFAGAPLPLPAAPPPPEPAPPPKVPTVAPPPPMAPLARVPVPPPAPPPVPPGVLREQIADVLRRTVCAAVEVDVPEAGPVVLGGSAADPDTLQADIAAAINGARPVRWGGQTMHATQCGALELVRAISPAPAAGEAPTIDMSRSGGTVLHDQTPIQPVVTMPDYAGQLRVDYIQSDGELTHLYPTGGYFDDKQKQRIAAQPARRFAPGDALALGIEGVDKSGAFMPAWIAGDPYGTDLLLVVATSAPLKLDAATNGEAEAAPYLRRLTQEIERVQRTGARISAAALPIRTLAK